MTEQGVPVPDRKSGGETGLDRARRDGAGNGGPLGLAIMLGFPTALIGSLAGAFLFWLVTMFQETHPHMAQDGDPLLGILLLLALPGAFMFNLPGLLIVGLPLSWPFRRSVVRHPYIAAILLALAGGAVASLFFDGLDRNTAFPNLGINTTIAFCYAGPTAVAWVFMLHRFRFLLGIEKDQTGSVVGDVP